MDVYMFRLVISAVYIVLLACHVVFQLDPGTNFVTILGFVRLTRTVVTASVFEEMRQLYNNLRLLRNKNSSISSDFNRQDTINIEKILEILYTIKQKSKDKDKQDIDFCINIISKNKMFVPEIFNNPELVTEKNDDKKRMKEEIAFWIQNFLKIERNTDLDLNDDEFLEVKVDTPRNIIKELQNEMPQNFGEKISKFLVSADSQKITSSLKNVNSLDFNVFKLKEASNNQELLAIMYYLFYHNDYFNTFNIRTYKFINFAKKVQIAYNDNFYHNATHGTDVMQVVFTLI